MEPITPPLQLAAGEFFSAFAAADLYAASVSFPFLLSFIRLFVRGGMIGREGSDARINSQHHPQLTVRALRTINEYRLRIIHRDIKRRDRACTSRHRHEAAMDPSRGRV